MKAVNHSFLSLRVVFAVSDEVVREGGVDVDWSDTRNLNRSSQWVDYLPTQRDIGGTLLGDAGDNFCLCIEAIDANQILASVIQIRLEKYVLIEVVHLRSEHLARGICLTLIIRYYLESS